MRSIFLQLLLAVLLIGPAYATNTQKEDASAHNPHLAQIKEKSEKLAQSLTKDEMKTLSQIRTNFDMIRSIRIAEKTVQNAVKQCSDKNPGIKADLKTRFKNWDNEIDGTLTAQEKLYKKSFDKEYFKDPDTVKDYLDTIDKAAHFAERKIDKKVVTTLEACQKLMDSMDRTQETILKLVNEMAWPEGAAAPETAAP